MRKASKRFLSLALVLAMMLGLCVTTWADDPADPAEPQEEQSQGEQQQDEQTPDGQQDQQQDEQTPDEQQDEQPPEEPPVAYSIRLNYGVLKIYVSDSEQLTAYVTPADAAVSWTSSNPAVASVTASGLVTGLKAGTAVITARCGDAYNECEVTVSETAPAVYTKVYVTGGTSLTLDAGESRTVNASVTGDAGNLEYNWSSDGNATVRGNGASATITAGSSGAGSVTLSVVDTRDGGNFDSTTWNVSIKEKVVIPELVVSVDPQRVMNEGEAITLTASVTGGDGRYTYSWYSSDSSVASVSGGGATATVSAKSGGSGSIEVVVTDSLGNTDNAVCYVKVNAKVRPTVATYSATGAAVVGTSLAIQPIASAIASQFKSQLGENLDYGADVYISTPFNSVGGFSSNGQRISGGALAYVMFESLSFEPYTAGTFATTYTIKQGELSIGGQITITVTGGTAISGVSLDVTGLSMATYSERYLALSVNPKNADVNVTWSSSNPRVASVVGNGRSATVTTYGLAGNTAITAVVTDRTGKSMSASCTVSVTSSATYNPTLSVTLDSDYYGTDTSDNMAKQFRDVFGYSLNYNNAIIRFANTGDAHVGVLRLNNGRAITANTNYTFNEWVNNIHFEPVSAGTFNIPYTLSYNGDTLSGIFSIYIRGANITAKLSPTTLSLASYSNQDLSLVVTPANSRYSVTWSSSNNGIATVSGNNYMARVETKGVAGTVMITARVTDSNGVSVYKQCAVTVTNSATYNPSVSTYIGVDYVGTGTSDAMINQFKNIYGVTMNVNAATIRFSSTGNNAVGIMRLKDGTAVKANTNYTMAQYIQMYTEPVSAGTFTIPYTLTYNNQSLAGDVNVVINGVSVNGFIELSGKDAYTFNTAAANGVVASTMLGNSITNAVGTGWSYLRFDASTNNSVGTLYRNANRSGVTATNIYQSDLGSLYFVPTGVSGTYSLPFAVYNSNGGTLSTGTLQVVVKGETAPAPAPTPAPAPAITFADVSENDESVKWAVEPVYWAVSKGITNGMGNNAAGQPMFEPKTDCNTAQIITFLWRSQGSPLPTISNPFSDVKSSEWFYYAALWAYEKGVVSGNTFNGTTPCTRASAVTFMWRLAGKPVTAAANFGDIPSTGEIASAVAWAVANGVTTGTGNDSTGRPAFSPNMICNRGQIVTFLYRAYK